MFSLLVVGVVRDIAPKPISMVIYLIKRLLRSLDKNLVKSDIFVYENNSVDYTKQLLKQCNKTFANFTYQTETIPYISDRLQRIATARNKTFQYICENSSRYDYVLVIDLDLYEFSIDDVFPINVTNWNVLTANGQCRNNSVYYDWLALRLFNQNRLPTPFPDKAKRIALKTHPSLSNLSHNDKPIPVWSAFAGMALYTIESIIQCTMGYYPYNGWCGHVGLHNQIINMGGNIFIYPKLHTRWHSNT